MLKICGSTIYGPVELIFEEALNTGSFPSEWRKGNVAIHKNADKKTLKNNSPFSLLSICGKIFQRLFFQ